MNNPEKTCTPKVACKIAPEKLAKRRNEIMLRYVAGLADQGPGAVAIVLPVIGDELQLTYIAEADPLYSSLFSKHPEILELLRNTDRRTSIPLFVWGEEGLHLFKVSPPSEELPPENDESGMW